jgi:solute carrier family 44 protein 1 (choline transporter-like protein)/choline transporter-like protein 2/4/5
MTTLIQNYTLILIAIPIAILLALVLMVLIRFLASCFIYILILVAIGSLIAIGVYVLTQDTSGATAGTVSFIEDPKAKIVFVVICFALAAIIFVVMCCLRSRIALASSVVEVSAVFVAGNCGIVLVPFLMFLVTIIFIALWIV